ncbi:MAG: transaldolase family protein [Syntrophorhabdus sp.]
MRPAGMKTRIFLDGGNPQETRDIIGLFGFLDGQTTNPTLISKNPDARERLSQGNRFCPSELITFYRKVVEELSVMMPHGSISVEVYADPSTKSGDMLSQGKEMFSWIPNAQVKFPTSHEGLIAASQALKDGLRTNMTLCFSQSQAAAVYAATKGAKKGDVYVSPFIGRLDDRGENGMDVIANIIKMYRSGDGHVEVLTASVRTYDHLMYALKLGSDIITAPYAILKEWGQKGLPMPSEDYSYDAAGNLKPIPYQEIDLSKPWQEYDIAHDLTTKGMEKFSADWNSLIAG